MRPHPLVLTGQKLLAAAENAYRQGVKVDLPTVFTVFIIPA